MRHKPYDLTTHDGKVVDWRTKAMLLTMEDDLGYTLTVIQGSPNSGVSASGGTHNGHGAVDLSPYDWERKVRAGRKIGFDIWHRPELWINGVKEWSEHIHGIDAGNKMLSPEAQSQVTQYAAHTDGLAGHAYDPFPFHPEGVTFDFWAWQRAQNLRTRLKRVVRRKLAAGDRVRAAKADRDAAQARISELKAAIRKQDG